ncbi:MAG TPA: orotidine-5'-phosphate decarboxylase [Candidatus Cloacimonadota bacterium]|nr:orotidine-5'-phosphate decarboxylase [Candidatus Cloacimonadota bacterium]
MSKSFWYKYQSRVQQSGSLICVGLDSQLDKLPASVSSSANPIWEFNRAIIDATRDYACAYKPNLAFYLADGVRGLQALYDTVSYIPDEIPVILDCKVGDIGSTMSAYVQAFFGDLKVDAITLNPLMGSDVIKALLDREESYAFALALTSNPSARDFFQDAGMADRISSWLQQYPQDRLGAVVGATQTDDLKSMRAALPGRIFLIPGVGAQGGDLQSVLKHAVDTPQQPNILINSSRGIIFASASDYFAERAGMEARVLYEQCKV